MIRTWKRLAGERTFHAKPHVKISLLAQVFRAPFLSRARATTNSTLPSRSPHRECLRQQRRISSAPARRTSEAPVIYAVDDVFWLTQLYTLVLEAAGCRVVAFNDRAEAL